MSKNNPIEFKGREAEFEGREASVDPLSELLQTGAQKLIHQAVEAELYAQLGQYAYTLKLKGESMRKKQTQLTVLAKSE